LCQKSVNGGTLKKAAQMANDASTHPAQLYGRRREELSLDEVDRIRVQAMAGRKEIRAITGYTHGKQSANAKAWHDSAISFHEAANVLHDNRESISAGFRVFAFNAAISLELIIKAILATEARAIPPKHGLRELARAASLPLDADQMDTLDLLSEIIAWLGRYPSPRTEQQWDNFHDNVFEQHKVRSRRGNVYTVEAHGKKFPSKENYMKIWRVCAATYGHTASSHPRLSLLRRHE
jgi:HEPN domain-containing protein